MCVCVCVFPLVSLLMSSRTREAKRTRPRRRAPTRHVMRHPGEMRGEGSREEEEGEEGEGGRRGALRSYKWKSVTTKPDLPFVVDWIPSSEVGPVAVTCKIECVCVYVWK